MRILDKWILTLMTSLVETLDNDEDSCTSREELNELLGLGPDGLSLLEKDGFDDDPYRDLPSVDQTPLTLPPRCHRLQAVRSGPAVGWP